MYQMFLDERGTLTLERAAFIIVNIRLFLITTEEELQMAKLGFKAEARRNSGTPRFRFPVQSAFRRCKRRVDALSMAGFRFQRVGGLANGSRECAPDDKLRVIRYFLRSERRITPSADPPTR